MKKLILSLIATLTISIGTASAIETNSVDSTEKKATEENIQTNLSSEESLKAAAENLNTICTMIKRLFLISVCLCALVCAKAQTTISGHVTDGAANESADRKSVV